MFYIMLHVSDIVIFIKYITYIKYKCLARSNRFCMSKSGNLSLKSDTSGCQPIKERLTSCYVSAGDVKWRVSSHRLARDEQTHYFSNLSEGLSGRDPSTPPRDEREGPLTMRWSTRAAAPRGSTEETCPRLYNSHMSHMWVPWITFLFVFHDETLTKLFQYVLRAF